jgi:hypothetical protein
MAITDLLRSIIVSGVGTASMFDPVYFQHRLTPVENAGEPSLSNVEFRDDAVLHVGLFLVELP